MHLVAFQLELFDRRPFPAADNGGMNSDEERDKRSSSQWLKAILGYLEFGTGDRWRRLSDHRQRWHPNRLWYLNGIGTIQDLLWGRALSQTSSTAKKPPQPVRRVTPARRREDRCA